MEDTNKIASIALARPLGKSYYYLVGDHAVEIGSRVQVPLGRSKSIGIVVEIHKEMPNDCSPSLKLKAIHSVLDPYPIFNQKTISLAKWLSKYYLTPIGEVLKTMFPNPTISKSAKIICLTKKGEELIEQDSLVGQDLRVVFPNSSKKKSITAIALRTRLKKNKAIDFEVLLDQLLKDKLIKEIQSQKKDYKTKIVETEQDSSTSENVNLALKRTTHKETEQQSIVIKEILASSIDKPTLLHGVTGSGKTFVYLQLIASLLKDDPKAQVLMLVPEISLTPQMTRVFEERYGDLVQVVHSGLSQTKRVEALERVRHSKKQILIGPRSSVFAPFKNLKLIIVDEEHDGSYKQQNRFCYHARDVSIVRAKLEKARVILGSATPSLESYHNALEGKYFYRQMPNRVGESQLPNITRLATSSSHKFASRASDRDAILKKEYIHETILEKLKETISHGQQAMVIINRRGFSHFVLDLEEKKAISCKKCDVSLTLHRKNDRLYCHYCGYYLFANKLIEEDPKRYLAIGSGSESVEEILKSKLPNANIFRLDSDSMTSPKVLENALNDFKEKKIDIMVGTQVLAKGHDFSNVTMMAMLDIDSALAFPDFRAGERTFQLLVQAAGRAGRGGLAGEVYMQGYHVGHPIIDFAVKHDFKKFADSELVKRKVLGYPPFKRSLLYEWTSTRQASLYEFKSILEKSIDQWSQESDLINQAKFLGPTTPGIARVNGRYRLSLIVLFEGRAVIEQLNLGLEQLLKRFKSIQAKVDVDPQHMV